MFGFGKSKERLEIEKDVKLLRDHGVEIKVVGRGTIYVDPKNIMNVKRFRDQFNKIKEVMRDERRKENN